MKKFIAVTSFLFILLLAILPSQASHAFAAANNNPSLTGITLVTDKGEIKATRSGNNFKFDFVGVPGDLKIQKLVLTSDTATMVSLHPQSLESSIDLDLHFENGVAYLDVDKYNDWYTRESQLNDGQDIEEGLITTGYFFTVQELRNLLDGSIYADGDVAPRIYLADANGNETEITLSFATKGWKFDKKWYYFDLKGNKSTGWLPDGDKWYFLDQTSGAMKTGWLLDGNKWYFLDNSGAMKTGWLLDGGKWYFLDKSGAMKTGWVLDGNKWYFLDKSGAMKTGWLLDGGQWYFLNNNGSMATGWLYNNNKWYYLNTGGKMATGWVQVSNKWYYLYSDGHMAANTKIGSYRIGKDGAWIR